MRGTGTAPRVRTLVWRHGEDTYGHYAPVPPPGPAVLPDDATPAERALLAGRVVRAETHAEDGSDRGAVPYLVTRYRHIVLRTPDGPVVRPLETITSRLERCLPQPDPRVTHEIALAFGPRGQLLESARVAYPRIVPRQPGQEVLHVTLTRHLLSDVDGRTAGTDRFEVTGLAAPEPGEPFTPQTLAAALAGSRPAAFEDVPDHRSPRHRLIAATRVRYWDAAMRGPLPHGSAGRGLVHHVRRLAVTRGLLRAVFGEAVDDERMAALGYLVDGAGYWITGTGPRPPSGPLSSTMPQEAVVRDPLGRVLRAERPDGTVSTTDRHAWRRETWDAGDTVLSSRWYAARGAPDPVGPEPPGPGARAAWLSARHADTPATTHLDPLGRAVIAIADAGGVDQYATHTALDASGAVAAVTDPRGLTVLRRVNDLLGRELAAVDADAGVRITLPDAAGRAVERRDGEGAAIERAEPSVHTGPFPDGSELLRDHNGLSLRLGGRTLRLIEVLDRDPCGRPTRVRHLGGAEFTRFYNATGELVADGPVRYAHDALGRHVATMTPTAFFHRGYDPAGNTLVTASLEGTRFFHHEEDPETGDPLSNRLMAHSRPRDAAGVFSALFDYDGRGRTVRVPGARLAWDAADRLSLVDIADGRRVRHHYEGTALAATEVHHPGGRIDLIERRGDWSRAGGTVVLALVLDGHRLGHAIVRDGEVTVHHGPPPPDPATGLEFRDGRWLAPRLGRFLIPPYPWTGLVELSRDEPPGRPR
ncbi:hypothetical protein Afil01_43310 [Actinorhabdospora filicis]|uniref:Insecticide toxin TcdB middle/C-terminal domain-containing protein n=1 Tax=Actinorhabdospora filicis TaxID=1785913 RepID=A0A9W6SP98_9ACTN|nr:toxin TcdB middle/C-terminal domain-containing protein [Actinorhabdospora filicis]GLZ79524.1 hypothetical protein Afil01_43310 [Actinorhabdospora filicis]